MNDPVGRGVRGRSVLGLDRVEPDRRQNTQLLERERDSRLEALAHTVSNIKGYVTNIHSSIKEGDHALNQLEGQMDEVERDLNVNIKKVKNLLVQSSSRHMCYLVIFFVAVIMLVYLLVTRF